MKREQLKVDPIKNGTVIDHISAEKALKVIELLNLDLSDNLLMIGMNLSSNKMDKKDIIKIENRVLTQDEADSIALISPSATIIIIEDYEVVNKFSVEIPDQIKNFIICPNPNCVTNIEPVNTSFELACRNPIEVRCSYCEKKYSIDDVRFSI
jgi:aspartate carbamoyltransferase regulatory subunit